MTYRTHIRHRTYPHDRHIHHIHLPRSPPANAHHGACASCAKDSAFLASSWLSATTVNDTQPACGVRGGGRERERVVHGSWHVHASNANIGYLVSLVHPHLRTAETHTYARTHKEGYKGCGERRPDTPAKLSVDRPLDTY
jgi:hypothetical protein